MPWAIVGFIFQYVIRRHHFSWWTKYNCMLLLYSRGPCGCYNQPEYRVDVLSAALDSSIAIGGVIIFFWWAISFPRSVFMLTKFLIACSSHWTVELGPPRLRRGGVTPSIRILQTGKLFRCAQCGKGHFSGKIYQLFIGWRVSQTFAFIGQLRGEQGMNNISMDSVIPRYWD